MSNAIKSMLIFEAIRTSSNFFTTPMLVMQRDFLEYAVLFQQHESTATSAWLLNRTTPIGPVIGRFTVGKYLLTLINVAVVVETINVMQYIRSMFTSFPY